MARGRPPLQALPSPFFICSTGAAFVDAVPVGVPEFQGQGISAYLVHMPKKADTHIQNTAPARRLEGWPVTAMLPLPNGARQGGDPGRGKVACVSWCSAYRNRSLRCSSDVAKPARLDPAGAEGEEHTRSHQPGSMIGPKQGV